MRPFRAAQSYVAGGVAVNWLIGERLSDDLDIFQDDEKSLPDAVDQEIRALEAAGFSVERTVQSDVMVEVIVRYRGEDSRVQWSYDEEYRERFFPAQHDSELGFRLHPADCAVNKVLCAARRREARDVVDVMTLATDYAPLGPMAWAAAGKADMSPTVLLRKVRATVFGLSRPEIETVRVSPGSPAPDWGELRATLAEALDGAVRYCEDIAPMDHARCLFVDADERPVEADEQSLATGAARPVPLTRYGPSVGIG